MCTRVSGCVCVYLKVRVRDMASDGVLCYESQTEGYHIYEILSYTQFKSLSLSLSVCVCVCVCVCGCVCGCVLGLHLQILLV